MRKPREDIRQWYMYQPLAAGAVRLLRVFGRDSYAVIPAQIAGGEVAEIGSYCFSEKEPAGDCRICSDGAEFVPDGEAAGMDGTEIVQQKQAFGEMCDRKGFSPLTGKNVTEIELPASVSKIGNFAFYQCRNLIKITLGMGMVEIGSDAFMNCGSLREFYFQGSPEGSSCLKQILAQRREETSVYFVEQGKTQAALLYPEYWEHYDLIGPAHIFALNIRGEGFRARQCFREGRVDFEAYDRIFAMECGEESVDTLCRMACSRLLYPVQLQEKERQLYETYVSEHITSACDKLVQERNYSAIQKLFVLGLIKPGVLERCLEQAALQHWTEGVRQLLSLTEGEKKGETEYGFQEF